MATETDLHLTAARFPEWVKDARCVGTDPEIFFPGPGVSPEPVMAICAACPVAAECLDWAISFEIRSPSYTFGIYGGVGAVARRALLGDLRAATDHEEPLP